MASIAPFGRYRGFDADGAPLAGGKLYTYEAGTTSAKTTYTSKSEATSNSNPVVLDADGYADVWLGTGGYKFILKDANDVTQWTVDNIDGGSATGFGSQVITRSSGFSLTTNEQDYVIVCTSSLTVSLLSAATAGDGFVAVIINTSNGSVTIDPSGSETINGAASLVLTPLASVTLHTDGTNWYGSGVGKNQFDDSQFRINDDADATKKLAFDVSGVTTGQTRTVTAQDVSGTMYVTGGQDVAIADGGTGASTASAAFTALKQAATTTDTGVVELGTKAEAETATDTSRVLPISAVINHPGVAKAWVNFNGTGTVAIRGQFNVASITDNGTGDYTVNLSNAMANANYVVQLSVAGSDAGPTGNGAGHSVTNLSTTSFKVNTFNSSTLGRVDFENIQVAVFGQLA